MSPDKLRRMRESALNHEDPICKFLTSKGVPAHRNTDVTTQRSVGDIVFTTTDGCRRSIECVKSVKHSSCSYAQHKPVEYKGVGKPEHAYSMFSCLQKSGQKEMIHVLVSAPKLHAMILQSPERFAVNKDGDTFYVISPGDLHALEGIFATGATIEEVLTEFLDELHKHA